jgi:hypothetical protein
MIRVHHPRTPLPRTTGRYRGYINDSQCEEKGDNNPSLADIVTMLDRHTPDFLLLTETPLHPHSEALTHTFRSRGCEMHCIPANAPPHTDTPLEARLLTKLIHTTGDASQLTRNKLQSLPLSLTSSSPWILAGKPFARRNSPSELARKQPSQHVISHNRWKNTLGYT